MRTGFSRKELIDSGMALALVLCIVGLWYGLPNILWGIALVLVVTMSAPKLLYPFAVLWYNFSMVMGTVSSKILLSLVFYLVVTPTAFFKKLRGYDPMKIKPFKKGKTSVFVKRNHTYSKSDLEKTY